MKDVKKRVEDELRNYPFYIISLDMSGLGTAVNPSKTINKYAVTDIVANTVISEEYRRDIVNRIEYVYDRLNIESKKVIDLAYFQGLKRDEILKELTINKNKYYKVKNEALKKFSIAFGYK
ncbi:DUF1492 domain-containing protein [uncultured Clostridium sp.]|uniref:DUF1492 domain-containing protein n=1 Tax=uncultured Clostridium sp. TaxID=59620 RepID=UPI0025F9F029|nr:DUF1492 domain-containing protein [uncultured Clostridium sp.]